MNVDKYGEVVLNEVDVCNLYVQNPDRHIVAKVSEPITIHPECEIQNPPQLELWRDLELTVEEYDRQNQSNWLMPQEYVDLDIAKWLLDRCETDPQRQRVGQELLLYLERDMFPLLQYLKYLVDTMRLNNIVWGVGRGSSVSSYVLYLIGVHRIDSMYWDLDIHEFLR